MVEALFAFRSGNSLLHKANAGAKIIFLFAFSFFVFWGSPQSAQEIFSRPIVVRIALCFAISAALFFLAGANWKSLLHLRFVFVIGAMVTAVKMIGAPDGVLADGAASGLLYTVRFFVSALAAQCVFETTSMVQIQESLRLPTIAALAINFIPQIFSEWQKIKLAARARTNAKYGAGKQGGPCGKRRANLFAAAALFLFELEALFLCMLQKAETTRKAVENRS
ncbi:MAG: hypothetical protein J5700_03270 [Treponema sp.]|nr:hypothetical protein [Treponema sp.]